MIQVWIIPVSGLHHQPEVCGSCPLMPRAMGGQGGCYVAKNTAPAHIYRKYLAGEYPEWDGHLDPFRNRAIRWGAWGEPTLIPLAIVHRLNSVARGWTGYTHRWAFPPVRDYRSVFHASVESERAAAKAHRLGWRTFHVSPNKPTGSIECAATRSGSTCADCLQCSGLGGDDIWIAPHGNRATMSSWASRA